MCSAEPLKHAFFAEVLKKSTRVVFEGVCDFFLFQIAVTFYYFFLKKKNNSALCFAEVPTRQLWLPNNFNHSFLEDDCPPAVLTTNVENQFPFFCGFL